MELDVIIFRLNNYRTLEEMKGFKCMPEIPALRKTYQVVRTSLRYRKVTQGNQYLSAQHNSS